MIRFTVYGHPETKGSTRAFLPKGAKHPIITNDNKKAKPWQQQISGAAFALAADILPRSIPVSVTLHFFFARPLSHGKKLKPHTVKPDADKCARLVNDALTGILFEDDSQITDLRITKSYGVPERVEIEVSECAQPENQLFSNSATPNRSNASLPQLG